MFGVPASDTNDITDPDFNKFNDYFSKIFFLIKLMI